MSEIANKVVQAWDKFVGLNQSKQKTLTKQQELEIDGFVNTCRKKGWSKRRITRAVRTKFKVNLV